MAFKMLQWTLSLAIFAAVIIIIIISVIHLGKEDYRSQRGKSKVKSNYQIYLISQSIKG